MTRTRKRTTWLWLGATGAAMFASLVTIGYWVGAPTTVAAGHPRGPASGAAAPESKRPGVEGREGGKGPFRPWYRGTACTYQPAAPIAGSHATLTPSSRHTIRLLTEPPQVLLPPVGTATPSEAALSPPMTVNAPNPQCPTLLGRVLPSVAFPRNTPVRQVEAYWVPSSGAATRLPLLHVFGTAQARLNEEGHSYGEQMTPFNTPLYDLTGIAAGDGTLEVRGYDAGNHEVWKVPVSGLHVSLPPAPASNSVIQARAHPRFLLTPARLANAAAKLSAHDTQAKAFEAARDTFLEQWNRPDHNVSGPVFADRVDNPGSYAAVLALCYQLDKTSNPKRAAQCAQAGKAISAWRLAVSNPTEWRHDTCYRMRNHFQDQLILYDALFDQFTAPERARIRSNLLDWVAYYLDPSHGCYSIANPPNNYYPPLLWAMAGAGIVFNGEDPAAARLLTSLRSKLAQEQTLLNQRACGGVWLEGTNYDADSMVSDLQVMAALQDYGEDWTAVFEALLPRALVYEYGVTRDGALQLPWGGVSGNRATNIEPSLIALLQSTTALGSFATHFYHTVHPLKNDWNTIHQPAWNEVLFGNLTQPASAPTALSCVASGAGRAYSVSSNTIAANSNGYLVALESQHQGFDHYGYSNGDVRFYRGSTCLLCASTYRRGEGCNLEGEGGTAGFSTFMAKGEPQYEYRRNRNNRWLFSIDQPGFAAWGIDITSSMQNVESYDQHYFTSPPVEYLVREVVHVRPDVLVVRNLHKRTRGADALVSLFHLGPTSGGASVGGGVYTIGGITIATTSSAAFSSVTFSDDSSGGCKVGRRMTITYPDTAAEIDDIEVFSDTGVTITGYSRGVLHLSNAKCVTFGSGTVSVAGC